MRACCCCCGIPRCDGIKYASLARRFALPCHALPCLALPRLAAPLHSPVTVAAIAPVVLALVDDADRLRHPAGREKRRQRLNRRVRRDIHRLHPRRYAMYSSSIAKFSEEFSPSPAADIKRARHARAQALCGAQQMERASEGRKGEEGGKPVSPSLQGNIGPTAANANLGGMYLQ